MIELNDSRVSNRQLQTRVDELREEISLQASFASNGSLLRALSCELLSVNLLVAAG